MLALCDGDCLICSYYRPKHVSLYDRSETDYALEEKLAGYEDAIDRDTLISLFMELDNLDPESRQICELMKEHSAHEAAGMIGMPYTNFLRRWVKIKKLLKENLKDIF